MDRREFIETSGVLAGGAMLKGIPGTQPAPKPPMVGIQVGAASFVDEGTDRVLDGLREMASINTLFVASFTYGRGIAGRQLPNQPLPDHGKQEYDTATFRGGNYATPHPQYYRNTSITPERAPDHPGYDVLADVLPRAHQRGMKVIAWFEDVIAGNVPGFDQAREVVLTGSPSTFACSRNPNTRNFWLGLVGDYLRSYDIDGLMWGSERQGPLGSVLGTNHGGAPFRKLRESLPGAIDVDALLPGGFGAILAEARHATAGAGAAMVRPQHTPERPLALAAPHQPVDVVRSEVVPDESQPEVAGIRIARAGKRRTRARQHDLARLFESRHVAGNHVLEPGDDFHAALMRPRQHVGQHVVARMIWRPFGCDARVAVVLRVGRRVVAAAKGCRVVFLLAVIGQWLIRKLPAGNAATVCKAGHEERVDRRHLAQAVEHAIGPFVHERHGADLDPHHGRFWSGLAARDSFKHCAAGQHA